MQWRLLGVDPSWSPFCRGRGQIVDQPKRAGGGLNPILAAAGWRSHQFPYHLDNFLECCRGSLNLFLASTLRRAQWFAGSFGFLRSDMHRAIALATRYARCDGRALEI